MTSDSSSFQRSSCFSELSGVVCVSSSGEEVGRMGCTFWVVHERPIHVKLYLMLVAMLWKSLPIKLCVPRVRARSKQDGP